MCRLHDYVDCCFCAGREDFSLTVQGSVSPGLSWGGFVSMCVGGGRPGLETEGWKEGV